MQAHVEAVATALEGEKAKLGTIKAQLAETIAFLASAENALTTGTLVPVYGRA